MSKSFLLAIVISVLVLFVASLFIFHIADSWLPKKSSDSAKSMDSKTTTVKGLNIEDIKVGTGPAVKNGDTVVMQYTGTLPDGTKFDSSYDHGQPFETQIGVGQVIKGWDLGIIGMKVGGKRKLVIPPELGYGSQAVGNIPPNSTLIFEVELLKIK